MASFDPNRIGFLLDSSDDITTAQHFDAPSTFNNPLLDRRHKLNLRNRVTQQVTELKHLTALGGCTDSQRCEEQAAVLHIAPGVMRAPLPLFSDTCHNDRADKIHTFGFEAKGQAIKDFCALPLEAGAQDSSSRVFVWIQSSGIGKTRAMYQLQSSPQIIPVCMRLATRAQPHGEVAPDLPVWSQILSTSETICSCRSIFTHTRGVNEAVQAEILLGITAHVFWILAVVSKAVGWEDLYAKIESCAESCDSSSWIELCNSDQLVHLTYSQRLALRQSYVLVLQNGGADQGVALIHQQIRSQRRLSHHADQSLETHTSIARRCLSLPSVESEFVNALQLLTAVSVTLTGDDAGAGAAMQVVLGVDELQVAQHALERSSVDCGSRDWFLDWQEAIVRCLNVCSSVVICGTTFALCEMVGENITSPLRHIMKPFYGRHFLSGDDIADVCRQYFNLPDSTGTLLAPWEKQVRMLAGRPLWFYQHFWECFIVHCRKWSSDAVTRDSDDVASLIKTAAQQALQKAGRDLVSSLAKVDKLPLRRCGLNPHEQLQNLYLNCKLSGGGREPGQMHCVVDDAKIWLAAAFPIKVTEENGGTTIAYRVTWNDEPIFRRALLGFGDANYLVDSKYPGQIMPVMRFLQKTIAQPGTGVQTLKGSALECYLVLKLLQRSFVQGECCLLQLLEPWLAPPSSEWNAIECGLGDRRVCLRYGKDVACSTLADNQNVRTSFCLMADGNRPFHDTVFFNIDVHAGPDLAFWTYKVDETGQKLQDSYRLVVLQAKSRTQVTWSDTMKSLMPERAYHKASHTVQKAATNALARGPLSYPWIRVPVNHGGYTKTLCDHVMKWNLAWQANAGKSAEVARKKAESQKTKKRTVEKPYVEKRLLRSSGRTHIIPLCVPTNEGSEMSLMLQSTRRKILCYCSTARRTKAKACRHRGSEADNVVPEIGTAGRPINNAYVSLAAHTLCCFRTHVHTAPPFEQDASLLV